MRSERGPPGAGLCCVMIMRVSRCRYELLEPPLELEERFALRPTLRRGRTTFLVDFLVARALEGEPSLVLNRRTHY
jgi:hypothetical protein